MSHEQLRDDLALYASGDLDAARASEIERHLAGCADCQVALSSLQRTLTLLSQTAATTDPDVDLSDFYPDRVAPALPRHRPLRIWALRAAALLLAFLAGVATPRQQPASTPPEKVIARPTVESPDKRLERAYLASTQGTDGFSRSLIGLSILLQEDRP